MSTDICANENEVEIRGQGLYDRRDQARRWKIWECMDGMEWAGSRQRPWQAKQAFIAFICALGHTAAWQTSLILLHRTLNHFPIRLSPHLFYSFLFSLPPRPRLLPFFSILACRLMPHRPPQTISGHKLCSLAESVTMPVYRHTLCHTWMGGGGRGRGRWSGRGGRV